MSNLLSQASLVMIPSGYKEDVVYSQIPTDGSGDLSFTRASNGTRVNSAGLVEVTPWNLLQQSEQIDNAAWIKFNCSITPNDAIAPNGTQTADKVVFSGSGHYFYQQTSFIGQATASIYVKGTAGETISIDNTQAITEPLITLTGEWQRITTTTTTSGSSVQGIALSTFQSATARTIYVWGGQVNAGTLKPYFPTTDRLNVPRLTYQNGGGGCPSLLLEKQSTNLVSYSEQFDNAYWDKIGATITANTTTSPDGTQNADTITGIGRIQKNVASTGTMTFSVFAKQGSTSVVRLNVYDGSTDRGASYNLSTGVAFDSYGSPVVSIKNYGNGWYRLIITTTNASTSNCQIHIDSENTAYIWGAQLEASSYPTSYIPTTSSSATRVADFGSSPLQTTNANWTIYVDTYFVQYEEILNLLVNTTTSRFIGFYESFNFFRLVGNAGAGVFAGRVMSDTDGRKKVVLQNDGTDCIVFVNGVKLGGVNTSGASPLTGRASFQLQFYGGGTGVVNKGRVNEIVQFDSKLTDAECIVLTTL